MRRRTACLAAALGVLALAAVSARGARAAVAVSPSQSSATAGQTNRIFFQYRFSGLQNPDASPYTGPADSVEGTFIASAPGGGPVVLGTVPTPVIAAIAAGAGTASETVTVPPAIVDSAIRLGAARILFERTFAGPANAPTSQPVILIASSEAVGPLRIRRIELYFENRRGEITVSRNRRGLKGFADIRFAGSGVLSGFWEVDGRRILDVNRQLNFGTSVTLSTPDLPDLPTFDTGAHIVRFVVTDPAPGGPLPQLLYYVTAARELRPLRIDARLEEGAGAPAAKHLFSWEKPPGTGLFFIEFSEEPGGKPVFSAYSREGSYALPDRGLEGVFIRGKLYYWRVKGYDTNDDQVAESAPGSFRY